MQEKTIADLNFQLRAMAERTRTRKSHHNNAAIKAAAIEVGTLAPGVEYWLVQSPMSGEYDRLLAKEQAGILPPGFCESISLILEMRDAMNGYVCFPKRRAPLHPKADILTYVPVHGGITYAVKDGLGCVFGFDTAHFNSAHVPRTDRAWVRWQCQVLYEGIKKAAQIVTPYKRAQTSQARGEIAQQLVDMIPEQELNLGTMINILSGKL